MVHEMWKMEMKVSVICTKIFKVKLFNEAENFIKHIKGAFN